MDSRWILPLIISLAFILRIINLGTMPTGFTPDEASHGYDAYSLLTTGRDQWGQSWPLVFQSFGDYKPPLYTYISIPFVALFGLTEFTVRLPSILLGTLAVFATYLLSLELFKQRKIALVSALFITLSPWHMPLSRGAFEANLTTLLLPLGVWLFLTKKYLFSGLVLGLNMLSYHSALVVTPLVFAGLAVWKVRALPAGRQEIRGVGEGRKALAILALLLFLAFYNLFLSGNVRGTNIAIFNPTDKWESVVRERYHAGLAGEPDALARVFNNKVVYSVDQFIKNYLSYFSIQFLGTQGAGEWTYGMVPGQGVIYPIEVSFLLFALWDFIKNKNIWRSFLFLLFWIVVAPIPAALTKGPGFAANRTAVMMPVLQIISAYGAVAAFEFLRKNKTVKVVMCVVYLVGIVVFFENYFFRAPANSAPAMLYGRQEAVGEAVKIENNYEKIIFSRSLSEPHIYVAFYKKWDPQDYQKQSNAWQRYKLEGRSFVDQLGEYSLGKYIFSDINFDVNSQKPGLLLIGKPEEFPKNIQPLKTIEYPDGRAAILIVDPQKATYAQVF